MIPSSSPRAYRQRLRCATAMTSIASIIVFSLAIPVAAGSHGADTANTLVDTNGTVVLTKNPPAKKSRAPVITMRPATANALETGHAALLKEDYPGAERAYRQALQYPADERDAWLGLASVAHHQGRLDEAEEGYRRALRHDPQNVTAQAGLISLLTATAPENAAALARALAERHPRSATAQAVLGDVLARMERLGEAQQAFFAASTLAPDDSIHAYNLAVALDRLHRPAQAASHYAQAIFLAGQSGAAHRSLPAAALASARQRLAQLRPQTAAAETAAQPLP